MAIGLFFFVKASIKERTEAEDISLDLPQQQAIETIETHFTDRGYRVTERHSNPLVITLEGLVRPSIFLSIFLTLLTAIGLFCLALVLVVIAPDTGESWFAITVVSPLAGLFYWRGARREEKVFLSLPKSETIADLLPLDLNHDRHPSPIRVTAHRDELIVLRQALNLPAKSGY